MTIDERLRRLEEEVGRPRCCPYHEGKKTPEEIAKELVSYDGRLITVRCLGGSMEYTSYLLDYSLVAEIHMAIANAIHLER